MRQLILIATAAMVCGAQTCPEASTFHPCDLVFEASAEARLDVEFRSPEFQTMKMPGYWNGRAMVVRFSPTMAGAWAWRATSNQQALNGKTGEFMAADSGSPGFLQVDNVRAWSYTAKQLAQAQREAHLWMGFQCGDCLGMDRAAFERLVETRAMQQFNHAVVTLADLKALDDAEARVRLLWDKAIFTDIQFSDSAEHLAAALPNAAARREFARNVVARFAGYGVTWQGVGDWETGTGGRALLRELGNAIKELDPYHHPRTTGARVTSAPLLADGWMTHAINASGDDALGSIESQTVRAPRVALEAPRAGFADRLWNATMSGMYPSFAVANDADAAAMGAWNELMGRTRFWEMEPHFDVDGARALYLTGVEYVLYAAKPATVDVLTEKKGYQVYWMNTATGTVEKRKKDFKGERFSSETPGAGQWVLHLSRDGRKEGMARSYHFESRRVLFQELESNAAKVPFELAAPTGDEFKAGQPVPYLVKLTKETRGTREMAYVLSAEATADAQGARVLATTDKGEIVFPENLARQYPAVVNLRLIGRNANGKIYSIDRVVRVTQ